MKTLTHIECPRARYSGDYFVTITLPPRHHRKGKVKQKQILDEYIKFVGKNYFIHACGAYEFTKKGILHAHLVVDLRNYFEGLKFENETARHEANISMLTSTLNTFSINDVQLVKNISNVYEYINKKIKITQIILGSSPYVWFKDKDDVRELNVVEVDQITANDLIKMLDEEIIEIP